ncbi:F-box/kelch-repeat protein At1g57790-like [Carex rostrata]
MMKPQREEIPPSRRSSILPSFSQQPWLLQLHGTKEGTISFINPSNGRTEERSVPEMQGKMKWLGSDGKLTIHFSKDGWIIASNRKWSLFILNSLTKQGIKLPLSVLTWSYMINKVIFSFSSVPTDSDCIVLGVCTYFRSCELCAWHRRQLSSNRGYVDLSGNLFRPTSASPVFIKGEFYILGREGDLLVFNPITKKLRFLSIPVPIHSRRGSEIKEEDCYLPDLAGDQLIYVLKESTMASYVVYRLDQSKMIWVELDDLGDMTAFLSPRSSMLRLSRNKMYVNGMLFPKFYGKGRKKPVFFSIQNHAFQPMMINEHLRDISLDKTCGAPIQVEGRYR